MLQRYQLKLGCAIDQNRDRRLGILILPLNHEINQVMMAPVKALVLFCCILALRASGSKSRPLDLSSACIERLDPVIVEHSRLWYPGQLLLCSVAAFEINGNQCCSNEWSSNFQLRVLHWLMGYKKAGLSTQSETWDVSSQIVYSMK
jgi:hypothetical protein